MLTRHVTSLNISAVWLLWRVGDSHGGHSCRRKLLGYILQMVGFRLPTGGVAGAS
jgi:hypothetical protein